MALFKINGSAIKKLTAKELDLEKHLQELFENNLEEILNIVFLAHEYSTSFGGRFENVEFVKEVPENKVLKIGDIISPFIGEAVRQCKFSVFEKKDGKFTVDNNTGVIRIDDKKVNNEYVAYIFNSEIGRVQLKHLIGGGGVPFLGAGNAKKLKIPLPPIATQNKIIDKIGAIYEKAKRLRQEAESIVAGAEKQIEQMILA